MILIIRPSRLHHFVAHVFHQVKEIEGGLKAFLITETICLKIKSKKWLFLILGSGG